MSMDDSQIIALFWNRDPSAIRESQQKYGKPLLHISFQILFCMEDSEECVNDTYYRAWSSIPPQKPNSLFAYLGRIVRNLSINLWYRNHAQKRGGGHPVLLSELTECIPDRVSSKPFVYPMSYHEKESSVEQQLEHQFLTETISQWLSRLPSHDRILFIRRYWYGDSIKQMADEYGLSPGNLSGRLHRLRKKLKTVLEHEGIIL